ncbi:MAG: cyclase family protein [Chloroflexota bacterium]|nr:cyclase family protein [Chloroflexota bacterium]
MNFKQLYDVSLPISNMLAVWPGDPLVEIQRTSEISQGATVNLSRLVMGSHTGTHLDAPNHFIEGAGGIDQVALTALVGTAQVVELKLNHHIGAADLLDLKLPTGTERILFKTSHSAHWQSNLATFQEDFIALAPDGAQWLVKQGIKLVGIDALSVERFDAPEEYPVHKILLGANIVIVEGLDLDKIEPGEYTVMALPLKIKDGDGAPARVLLAR